MCITCAHYNNNNLLIVATIVIMANSYIIIFNTIIIKVAQGSPRTAHIVGRISSDWQVTWQIIIKLKMQKNGKGFYRKPRRLCKEAQAVPILWEESDQIGRPLGKSS